MPVAIGSVDEKCKPGGFNFREKIQKGLKNSERCSQRGARSRACRMRISLGLCRVFWPRARYAGITTQDDITTWKEFKKEFRLQFIGALDKTDIEEELLARTQAKGENITNFLPCFKYIVGHFKRPPLKRKLVKIVYENILPEYRTALFDKKEPLYR